MSALPPTPDVSLRRSEPTRSGHERTHALPQNTSSWSTRQDSLFPLDLNGSTVVIDLAGKNHQVATRDLLLAAHHLTDWSDCINDGCPRRIGHEALQWF